MFGEAHTVSDAGPPAHVAPWRHRHIASLYFLNSVQMAVFAGLITLYGALGDGAGVAALALMLAAVALARLLLARGHRAVAAQLSALVIVAGVHLIIWLDGGAISTSAMWLALVPFAVSMCGGKRTYAAWTFLSWVVAALMIAGIQWGALVPPEVPSHAVRWVTLFEILVGLAVLATLHGRSDFAKRAAERDLAGVNARLATEVGARVRAERAAREAAAAAEAASAARAMFLATVSHEVRTPLSVMLGLTDGLQQRANDRSTAEALRSIGAAGQLAVRLLNDTLDLTRAESGGLQLVSEPVSLPALVREVAASLQRSPAAAHLQVRAEIDPSAEGWVRSDGGRLRQMLYNLGINAVKFTEAGSVTLQVRRDGYRATVEVSDTGPGLSAEVAAGLFRPFQQAGGETHRRHGGAGLGLAIVRGLAEAMDGSVGVRSEIGRGSTFWFTIRTPRAEAPADAPVAAAPPVAAPPGGLRVLLVEDNPALADLGAKILQRAGAQVLVAHDGVMALTLARHHPVGLVLLDLGLPDMRGNDVLVALRALGVEAPIIALTGMDRDEMRRELGQATVAGVIQKPFQPEQIETVVRAVAAGAPLRLAP